MSYQPRKVYDAAVLEGVALSGEIQRAAELAGVTKGTVYPAVTTAQCGSTPSPNDATVAADKHYITAVATITPGAGADDGSSVLYFRLYRDANAGADTYEGDAGLLSVDAHFESNKLGSNTQAPD